MKQPIFKKTTVIDQKRIEFIELLITRLVRRSHEVAKAIITPFPISNAVVGDDVKDVILRYIFPCRGKITKGYIKLDKRPKIGVAINIKIFNELTSKSESAVINKKIQSINTSIDIFPGDCFEVSVASKDVIKEVWISMLWVPDRSVINIEDVMIEELEKITEKFIEESNA